MLKLQIVMEYFQKNYTEKPGRNISTYKLLQTLESQIDILIPQDVGFYHQPLLPMHFIEYEN